MAASPIPAADLVRFPRIRVGGCPVDCLSFEEAAGELCRRIEQGIPTHVVFINAAKVVNYRRDVRLRAVIDRADLLLADGVPVVWVSALSGRRLPGRVNGTDLMERMLSISAERNFGVFLLGGTDAILSRAAAEFRRRYPGLRIVGARNGYFSDAETPTVVEQISQSHADLLFVGMSTPRKEIWADSNLGRLGVTVCQGVGGSFDVAAGVVPRAPRWMQRCGLEWFHRLLQEPRRMFSRYASTNPVFVWLVLSHAMQHWTLRIARRLNY